MTRPATLTSALLMSATLTATFATACGAGSTVGPDADPASDAAAVDPTVARLEAIRVAHDLPSLAGLAVRADEVVGRGATGVRRLGQDAPITIDDRWHLGSCTKAMTATLVAMLVEADELAWDTTMAEAFPDATVDPGFAAVTVEQLLAHRGGAEANLPLQDLPAWDPEAALPVQRAWYARQLLGAPPATAPGAAFLYSNAGYITVGAILEARTGMAWEELVRARIFTPLGMTSCGFGPPTGDQPWGHIGTTAIAPGPQADNPAIYGPAGTVHCSLADWAKFAGAHLAGERGVDGLVTAASFRKLHTPAPGPEPRYALGWGVIATEGHGDILVHSGSNTMWMAEVAIVPADNSLAVAATNIGTDGAALGVDEAVAALLEAAAP